MCPDFEDGPEEARYAVCVQLTRFFAYYVFLSAWGSVQIPARVAGVAVLTLIRCCRNVSGFLSLDEVREEVDSHLKAVLNEGNYVEYAKNFKDSDFELIERDAKTDKLVSCLLCLERYQLLLLLLHHVEMLSVKEAAELLGKSIGEIREGLISAEVDFARLISAGGNKAEPSEVAIILSDIEDILGEELKARIEAAVLKEAFSEEEPGI